MIIKFKWKSKQIDYVLAFPQAPIERELYMAIPKGFKMDSMDGREHASNVTAELQSSTFFSFYWIMEFRNGVYIFYK